MIRVPLLGVFLALLPAWLEPATIVERGGLLLVAAVVFAETGLFVGFFLPGDSLLFFAGLMSSAAGGNLLPSIAIVIPVLFLAAAAGDQTGYQFGHRVGPSLFRRPRSRVFNPANLTMAASFFDRHGPRAIVLARFVPIVRTFAPMVAGASGMSLGTFTAYNLVGAAIWGAGIPLAGYFLGEWSLVRDNVEVASLVIVALSFVPMVLEARRHRRNPVEPSIDSVTTGR